MAEKRSIFEEVKEPGHRSGPVLSAVGAIDRARGDRRGIRLWLLVLAALVAAMILVGGMTRLTDSGLAITEWAPVTGAVPPLSEADWQVEFDRYRQIPEYQQQNRGMSLGEFKRLYWWEWGHRQMGRVIGLVWAAGFLWFWLRRRIPAGWTGRLLLLGALGGVQGAIGWWMVRSGLEGEALDVASYRLATHLGLAFLILGLILWDALLLGRSEAELMKARRAGEPRLAGLATGVMHLAVLQILLGALVAGIDAGRGFTDWPLMAGRFFPEGAFEITPVWRNFFENDGLVQFLHRMTGYLVLLMGLVAWLRGRRSAHADTRRAFLWLATVLLLQVLVGVVTVMNSSPLHIAIFHQAGAILVWALILRARFLARYPVARSLRGAR